MLQKNMGNHQLNFFSSLTVCPSDMRKVRHHIGMANSTIPLLKNILISPVFANLNTMKIVRQYSENGTRVLFDSGGYYVQTGRLKYKELYMPLLETYKSHPWADIYTLPDNVPTSQDPPEVVEQKVKDTITFSTIFFQEMADDLKSRAMPVVQGHTIKQVEQCLKAYINMGVMYIGFGSFGTMGNNNQVNIATNSAIDLSRHVVEVAHAHGIKVHLFGIGAPALVAMIKGINADSFDSSAWLKAAGFGQIFLPFMRGYNITHNSNKSKLQKSITFDRFNQLRELTKHHCSLCESVFKLQDNKMYRAVHNLIALEESVKMVNSRDYEHIERIYINGSPKYRNEFEKWLRLN